MAFEWSPGNIMEKISEPFVELGKGVTSIFMSPAKGTVGPSDADRKSAATTLEAGARGLLARKSFKEATSGVNFYAIRARNWAMPHLKRARALCEQTVSDMAQGGAFEKQTVRGYGAALLDASKTVEGTAQVMIKCAKQLAIERSTPVASDLSAVFITLNLGAAGLTALTSTLVCVAEVAGMDSGEDAVGMLLGWLLTLAFFFALYYAAYFLFLLPVPRRAVWLQAELCALCVVVVFCLFGGWAWALVAVANLLLAAVGFLLYTDAALTEPKSYVPLVESPLDPKAVARSVEPSASQPTVQRIYAPCKYP